MKADPPTLLSTLRLAATRQPGPEYRELPPDTTHADDEMAYRIVKRTWRHRKPMWILMVLELALLIPALVLFGIEQPDLYRTKFWQIGYDNGLNSNPNMILYAYANYKPLPTVPFVWSQRYGVPTTPEAIPEAGL